MKVDTGKLKKGSSELTPECRQLIEEISKCRSHNDLFQFLDSVRVWVYGKCELYHWIEILDRFDKILEEAAHQVNRSEFVLHCDTKFSKEDIRLLLLVLNFTTLLIEHSFSRHLYNSIEHLTQLLSSQNMEIVLAVLNLLYMFSKRSNFIPRLSFEKKEKLLIKLFNIAERWGDPNYGLALIDCCMRKPKLEFLYQLFIEYVDENGQVAILEIPDMLDVCSSSPPSEVVEYICKHMSKPTDAIKMRIAHRVRLVSGFKDYKMRLQFVQARLQAISVLIYSNALQDNIDKVLYPGFGEELCELIDKEDVHLVEIRAAVLRTLTSMLHFDRNPNVPRPGSRLPKIIQYTGAERQGGILPVLVRDCIASLTGNGSSEKYPLILATSLFSLLYHLASYEAGGHALVKSGMMQSLLRVINWSGVDLEHITFVTRAVRVIDLITNIDIAKFHQNNGLNIFIDRLEKEVKSCREALNAENQCEDDQNTQECNVAVEATSEGASTSSMENRQEGDGESNLLDGPSASDANAHDFGEQDENLILENDSSQQNANSGCSMRQQSPINKENPSSAQQKKCACLTQRAALLKSMLNFLKKSIQDHAHFNGMRNIMETSLPCSLRHIISNAEYYGPSLFLLATDVVTVYVFNEPSLLSSLQDSGITNVLLQSLLQKDVPATREVLGSLPNVFSAMCLNERGLMEFMSYEPFDKLLKVLLSPDYLVAMRRRRSSDPLGDTATNLGNAMDDLMKHHPYLRTDATEAIVRLLNELVRLGSDPNYVCWRANKDSNSTQSNNANSGGSGLVANSNNATDHNSANQNNVSEASNENENDSSAEDDDDDDEMSSASQQQQQQRQNRASITSQPQMQIFTSPHEREAIPLIDYILNVMKFIEAIFSNSSNGDHCREFVLHEGLKPLLQILSLPNLPVDSPVSTTAQAVANVCKSILNLAHETKVIDTALQQLSEIVSNLKPLTKHFSFPGGSVLLSELLSCPKIDDGFSTAEYTPLLHSMSSVHGYVVMLVHLCRNASSEMRLILLRRWGTNCATGLELLQSLVQLYISLVWESTILLNLCSDESYAQNPNFNWDEMITVSYAGKDDGSKAERDADNTRRFEKASTSKQKVKPEEQLRYIKSLLAASSRLGRALAELFGTLVKLCVGTPQYRQRRNNEYVTSITSSKFPTTDAKEIARVLSSILVNGFSYENILPKPVPKLKLTFLICSVGFTGPMLFDDKRSSFHLMISQFCEENGLKAFFDMFYWALSLDNSSTTFSFANCMNTDNILEDYPDDANDFPEGTGEFLDAWLQLLEKMVNPRAILESPYAISPRAHHITETVLFEPIFYLIQIHQLALHAIKRIWKRKPTSNYGRMMTETMLAVLKHLIRSYSMLSERYQARLKEIQTTAQAVEHCKRPLRLPDDANVNTDHVKMLTDMGFARQQVLEALRNTRSLEQATDYLLNHPESSTSSSASQSRENTTQIDSSNSNSMPNQNNDMDIDVEPALEAPKTSKADNTATKYKIKLIPNEVFNKFCEEALERTFAFMEFLPDTVNTGAELISVLFRRHNQANKHFFVLRLVKNITSLIEEILENLNETDTFDREKFEDLTVGNTATKLLIRLKVSTLLLDEAYVDLRNEFCATISQEQSLSCLLSLMDKTENVLRASIMSGGRPTTPCWLQNLIEFIDAIDNISVILQRKENMRAVCSDNWKWYDASTGKWNSYSEANNIILKNAFNRGERSVVINIGRQRYTINFNCMTQVSEASGSHRPVLPSLKIIDAIATLSNSDSNNQIDNILTRIIHSKSDGESGEIYRDEVLNLRLLTNFSQDAANNAEVPPASEENKEKGTATDHTELAQEVDASDASAAAAATTVSPSTSTSTSAVSPSTPNATTSTTPGKNIKTSDQSKTATATSTTKGKSQQSPKMKRITLHEEKVGLAKYDTAEIMVWLVRMLQPVLSLDYNTKLTILKLCARLTKNYANAKVFLQNGGVDLLLNMRQICEVMGFPTYSIVIIRHLLESPPVLQEAIERILAARTSPTVPVGHRDLVFVLTQVSSAVARDPKVFLNAAKQTLKGDYSNNLTFSIDDSRLLVKSQAPAVNRKSPSSEDDLQALQTSVDVVKELLYAVVQPCVHYGGFKVVDEFNQSTSDSDLDSPVKSTNGKKMENIEPCCCSWHVPSNGHLHKKPVLPRSTLLKILADAVRSYQSLVPRVIIEHVYTPSDSALIKNDQSFLSFILDNFLPIVRRQQDSEVSMMSRILISSLSDCCSQPTVQAKVVEEIHDALVRALLQTDSTEKHTRLQVLIGLLPMLIESPMLSNKMHVQRNNMYRILLRQGIMTDLSKIAQYKDLSNSNALNTIYSILRPMEILLRLTVAPGALSSKRILFGTAPQGSNSVSITNRRMYPRTITSRSPGAASSSSIGNDHVLRDIIRNVLSDRRHALDFIFNADDIFIESEDALPPTTIRHDDDVDDDDVETNAVSNPSNRPQLNFERLLNDSLRLISGDMNTNSGAVGNGVVAVSDHHHLGNSDNASNNDNGGGGGGGSDGASTSSETAAAVVENAASLLGEVTSSESDSDSNVSTENDEHNDDDEEDDDDDDDGNEEGVEDRSETDADEETRQFIEVFDHIYEPESSETASNDADVDADDEASVMGGGANASTNAGTAGTETNSSEAQAPSEEEQNERNSSDMADQAMASAPSAALDPFGATNRTQSSMGETGANVSNSSIRTTPTSAWVAPRMSFVGMDGYPRASIDLNVVNAVTTFQNDRGDNNVNAGTAAEQPNLTANNTHATMNNGQRREPTRRLVFLDQQYCAPMPSFNNPTEEGQIELFNQDVLHWWLEEAKHLDLESQSDACLYVAHLLIPFLIKELKLSQSQKKIDSVNPAGSGNTGSINRRSAIPVLIQQSINSVTNVPVLNNSTTSNSNYADAATSVHPLQDTSELILPATGLAAQSTISLPPEQSEESLQNAPSTQSNIFVEQHQQQQEQEQQDSEINEDEDDEEDNNYEGDNVDEADDALLNPISMEEDELSYNIALPSAGALPFQPTRQSSPLRQLQQQQQHHQQHQQQQQQQQLDESDSMSEAIYESNDLIVDGGNVDEQQQVEGESEVVASGGGDGVDGSGDAGEGGGEGERDEEEEEDDLDTSIPSAANTTISTITTESSSSATSERTSDDADATEARNTATNETLMSPEVRAALGDLEVPEGVDPSFLAALPSEMREEVIQEHLRMQRIRQRAQQNAIQVAHDSLLEVNPEFLAALPPNIQSEVLMQQRIEQQRQAAQTANPDDPVDTAAFFQNLPESLRQAILTDMEESQIATLPPDLAAEAQYLRRDWENRNGARLDPNQSGINLSGYLTARFPSSMQNMNDESRWHTNSIWYDSGAPSQTHHQHTTIIHQHQLHGKPIALLLMEDENNLLDPDSLTTLLLFLFIEDSKMNYTRLHRIVRNLCYHVPTREWIINALISIIQKTNEVKMNFSVKKGVKPQWLKLRVEAAFGYKSNVFIINKLSNTDGANAGSEYNISINPQAAQMIVRNCLDMLFVLAKHFPRSFVPYNRDLKHRSKHAETVGANNTAIETRGGSMAALALAGNNWEPGNEALSPFQRQNSLVGNNNSGRRSAGAAAVAGGGIGAAAAAAAAAETHLRQTELKTDTKLDESPSTSKAAAVRNKTKSNINCNKSKTSKGLQYNTNSKHFWDVLLNIDTHTNYRYDNLQAFPINSQPTWEWENQTADFLCFNESPFAKLLEMLPYKVICRSPQLTDMLIKLLASLSNELPKEDDSAEQGLDSQEPCKLCNQPEKTGDPSADVEKDKKPADKDSYSEESEKCPHQSHIVKCRRKIYSKNFSHLQLLIEVLTHQCGTAEGLDNISKLIVNMSQCSQASNAIFLQYLISAILGLAQEVRRAISDLLDEIRIYNNSTNNDKSSPTSSSSFAASNNFSSVHGIMQDRFTASNVVISAPKNIKPSCELQLPAMKKLLSSQSAQPYFLRTLKIFMQVRDLLEAQEANSASEVPVVNNKPTLSQIICLDDLWNTLSDCLIALEQSRDEYAVLVLQPTVEAFFLIHASQKKKSSTSENSESTEYQRNQNSANSSQNREETNSSNPLSSTADAESSNSSESNTSSSAQQHTPSSSSSSSSKTVSAQRTEPTENADQTTTNSREMQMQLDRKKFLSFAEKHRTVLNQILRQSPTHLSDGPFAVLVDHTRILDFDVKRKYFQTELERIDEGVRREENTVSVRRVTVFEDSFRVLYRLSAEEWKNRFYIVFEDEEGQDAGGLLREWYVIISREIFNPMYALFCVSPGDRVTYMINPSSHANPNHLSYFKFVGRVIAKAIHDNKLLECYFTRSFYKHILGKQVKHTDMESQDYEFYKGLDYLMKNDISTLGYELTFSTEVQEFGVTQVRDLIPTGRDIAVNEENKFEYVQLVCQLKMSGSIRQQLDAFLEGFYDIIPKHLISIFNEQELELLISGLPDIDIEDLKANTEYHKYTSKSIQIQWFWRALRSFDQADRAKFLQFVTGTSKVPLQGFGSLEGMNGIQKFQIHRDDRSTDRLPCAHTCFNQLDLPMYKSYDKLRSCLLKAIHECSEGFGFA